MKSLSHALSQKGQSFGWLGITTSCVRLHRYVLRLPSNSRKSRLQCVQSCASSGSIGLYLISTLRSIITARGREVIHRGVWREETLHGVAVEIGALAAHPPHAPARATPPALRAVAVKVVPAVSHGFFSYWVYIVLEKSAGRRRRGRALPCLWVCQWLPRGNDPAALLFMLKKLVLGVSGGGVCLRRPRSLLFRRIPSLALRAGRS